MVGSEHSVADAQVQRNLTDPAELLDKARTQIDLQRSG